MILHIPQCRLCNQFPDCEYRKEMIELLKPISPKGRHLSHQCSIFRNLFSVGDRIHASILVAYYLNDESGRIDTEYISGTGVIVEKSSKGRLLIRFDDQENAAHFAEAQRESRIGFYGKIVTDDENDRIKHPFGEAIFEEMRAKGFPFWAWPVNLKHSQQ